MDVKTGTGTLDMVDFATTRIPIRLFFVAYHITSLRDANVSGPIFTRTATTL
jgi:hypothetical protein